MKKQLITFCCFISALSISVAQNNAPVAVNDTVSTFRGHIKIDVLNNDYDIDGNYISINMISPQPKHGIVTKINDSIIEYTVYPSFIGGIDSFAYKIRDNGSPLLYSNYAKVFVTVDNSLLHDFININNVNAGFYANGNLFSEVSLEPIYRHFYIPNGSVKSTIFSGNLWIGGKDSIDTLHVAAQKYCQLGHDFWAGPVSDVYDSLYDVKWNRIWKIKKSDIVYHNANCWLPGYVPSQVMIDWPCNGDTTLGQMPITAPFKDWNNDGIYNPYAGDFPLILGDEAVYFIINDDRHIHSETTGQKLKIEIHAMAYSFDCYADSALWNSIFLNYKIYNRSSNTYDSTYIASFIDLDDGFSADDFIGSDVQRGSFYAYNGKKIDGSGQYESYGAHPPAQGVVFLAGAQMDNDGLDNPSGLCDNGLNGYHFGNSIIDDERYGLSRFVYFNNTNGPMGDPNTTQGYYNYMKGIWKDSSPMMWGGNAHVSSSACGPVCNFMFPGYSDTICHWGTNGLMPNCDTLWTEETVGNMPNDRRGVGVTGPFTFKPGDMQQLDLAFVFGRDFVDTLASAAIAVMNQRIDSIIKYFRNDATPCGGGFSAVSEVHTIPTQINIFPNPSIGIFTIEQNNATSTKYILSVMNIQGQLLLRENVEFEKSLQLDLSKFANGIYFLSLQNETEKMVKKVVVQR